MRLPVVRREITIVLRGGQPGFRIEGFVHSRHRQSQPVTNLDTLCQFAILITQGFETLEPDLLAVNLNVTRENLVVDLRDGRTILVPLEWYPRLLHASPKERRNWQLLGGGYAVEWPDLDEHIGIEGLVAGRRSGESRKSFQRWLDARQGAARTKRK